MMLYIYKFVLGGVLNFTKPYRGSSMGKFKWVDICYTATVPHIPQKNMQYAAHTKIALLFDWWIFSSNSFCGNTYIQFKYHTWIFPVELQMCRYAEILLISELKIWTCVHLTVLMILLQAQCSTYRTLRDTKDLSVYYWDFFSHVL